MAYLITEVLFDWLQKKRLISAVARRMGVNENTLISQLRPTTNTAKFAADDLVPLFDAIREAGYAQELIGIVREYAERLQGDILTVGSQESEQTQLMRLVSGVGAIAEQLADNTKRSNEADLVTLLNRLRTEVFPTLLQLEANLADKLSAVRKHKRGVDGSPSPSET